MLALTRKFTFEMAHALSGYDGACRNIHGHSYKLYVTIEGQPQQDTTSPKLGMVIDFTEIKRVVQRVILDKYDHALVLKRGAVSESLVEMMAEQWSNIIEVDYQPTCENMVVEFYEMIVKSLPKSVKLSELKLYETENSYVTYRP